MEYPFSVIAVDVGGTKIACALVRYECVEKAPVIVEKRSVPTHAREGGEAVLDRIVQAVRAMKAFALESDEALAGIGVGTAGRVDARDGSIAYANEIMPGWTGRPVAARLRDEFGMPVAVLGDVQSHALGEARWGAARGAQTCIVMAPGTGLGGGLIVGGRIVRGAHGFAGEIGATPNTLAAGDGNLESVASGSGIEARYEAKTGTHLSGAEISAWANEGDPAAREAIENAGRALGIALAGWANMLDPEMAVVSGSVVKAGPIWRDALQKAYIEHAPAVLGGLRIVDASLGDAAPLIGAAENLLDSLEG
ncbi:MAG: ROK family protein [Slackia sp.]|nr:ROK family protein [Slackia sp.]